MKLNIFLIIFSFVLISICSTENSDSLKKNEFLIGGGIKSFALFEYYNDNSFYNNFPLHFVFGVSVPVSYIYYISEKAGLGISLKTGFEYFSENLINKELMEKNNFHNLILTNTISFISKFGKAYNKQYLLMEYGVISHLRNLLSFEYIHPQVLLSFGPSLFIGSDIGKYKNFLFTSGGFIDVSFYINTNGNNLNNNYITVGTGVEFRWRYSTRTNE